MRLLSLLGGLLLLLATSCNKNEDGTAPFIVRLTDSPGDYEEVNIDVQAVQVHVNEGEQQEGWITLDANTGNYDLLMLTDGAEAVLVNQEYPAGHISQLRLVLGDQNSVVIDSVEYPIKVPSGAESGLKLLVHADLIEGINYSVLLDFDAAKSVVKTGAGNYILKPTIKTITEALDGAVIGSVYPDSLSVAVFALSGEDTLSTSYAVEGNADFFLGGLADGDYTISFDPGELSGFQGKVIENVTVSVGNITDIGEVQLVQ